MQAKFSPKAGFVWLRDNGLWAALIMPALISARARPSRGRVDPLGVRWIIGGTAAFAVPRPHGLTPVPGSPCLLRYRNPGLPAKVEADPAADEGGAGEDPSAGGAQDPGAAEAAPAEDDEVGGSAGRT